MCRVYPEVSVVELQELFGLTNIISLRCDQRIVDIQVRAESWVHPLGGLRRIAMDSRQDPALSLVDVVWRMS